MRVVAGETFGWETAEVLFNGAKPPPYILEADDQVGTITCHRAHRTKAGYLKLEHDEQGKPVVDIYHGQVEIRGLPELTAEPDGTEEIQVDPLP